MDLATLTKSLLSALAGPTFATLRGKALSDPDLVRLFERIGVKTLSNAFGSIYAHAILGAAASGCSEQSLALFAESEVICSFEEFWRNGEMDRTEQTLRRVVEQTAKGDAFRAANGDIQAALTVFTKAFVECTQRARDPGQQEILRKLDAIASVATIASEEPQSRPWPLHGVPPLPPQYIPRSEFDNLKRALLSQDAQQLVIAGQPINALQGMAGVGKTMMAAALARDPSAKEAFPDGVFWLTFGQQPDSKLVLMNRLIAALSGNDTTFGSEAEVSTRLQELLAQRACLLVLDDVWADRHAEPFRVAGPRCKLLLTTRRLDVLAALDADAAAVKLAELSRSEALNVLARYAGVRRADLPAEAIDIVEACGELPLAIAVAGAQLRGRKQDRWKTMVARLHEALQIAPPGYEYPNLASAVTVSVQDLTPKDRARYLDLAVFPEDAAIPETTLAMYWFADSASTQATIDAFVDRALAKFDSAGNLVLHDLLHDFVRAQAEQKPLHRKLVDAYRAAGNGEFFQVPNDGYAFDHLAAHLLAAEGADALRMLLFDLRWLNARLQATDVNRLLTDFELARCPETTILATTLRQASHVLREKAAWNGSAPLAGQILARMLHRPEPPLRELCERARTIVHEQGAPEPLTASLQSSSALELTLIHYSPVYALAVLDDRRFASSAEDGTIKLWNQQTGACEATLEGHADRVYTLAVLRDGRLASGSDDGTIKLWNPQTGVCEATLEGHADRVYALAVLRDGRLASGSGDRTIKLWNPNTGACETTLKGHADRVSVLAMLGESRLASASGDRTIKLWNPHTGLCEATLKGHASWVYALAVLSDGRLASGGDDGKIKLWNPQTGACDATLGEHGDRVYALAVLGDGRLASGEYDGTIKLWNPQTGARETTHEGHAGAVSALAVLGDGRLASGSGDRTIKLWNPHTGACDATLDEHTSVVSALAVLGDGRLASGSGDRTIKLWNPQTGACDATLKGHANWVSALAVLRDGRLASGTEDGTIKLWNPQTGACDATLEGYADRVHALAVLHDGRLALGSWDQTIKLWTPQTGACEATLEGHVSWVTALAVLGDGRLASGSYDGTIKLWNPQTGAYEATLEGHARAVSALAVLGDGRLASGSWDRTIKLWNPETGDCEATLEGHARAVSALAMLGDGRLVSGSYDNTIRLWTVQQNLAHAIAAFIVDASIASIAWLQNAALLAVGDAGGRIHFLRFHGSLSAPSNT